MHSGHRWLSGRQVFPQEGKLDARLQRIPASASCHIIVCRRPGDCGHLSKPRFPFPWRLPSQSSSLPVGEPCSVQQILKGEHFR